MLCEPRNRQSKQRIENGETQAEDETQLRICEPEVDFERRDDGRETLTVREIQQIHQHQDK